MSKVQEQFIRVGGFETRVITSGAPDDPPLLLLHDGAWGGSAELSWGAIIPVLGERYRVIAPDMLGFGLSAKVVRLDSSPYEFRVRHLVDLLDELGVVGPVHVVGTSFGGSIGLHMLGLCAERVASLITISGTGGPWRSEFGIQILGSWDGTIEGLIGIVDNLAEQSPEFSPQAHLAARLASASAVGHYRAMVAPGVALPEPLRQVNSAAAEWPKPIEGNPTPVLLVQGMRDALVQPDWPAHLLRALPNSSALRLDSLHSPNLTSPGLISKVIAEWVDRGQVAGAVRDAEAASA